MMNEKLLRSIMALKGDYDAVCLAPITNLSPQAINQRIKNEVPWKQPEINAIAKEYDMDAETIAKVFELTK